MSERKADERMKNIVREITTKNGEIDDKAFKKISKGRDFITGDDIAEAVGKGIISKKDAEKIVREGRS